MIKMTSIFQLSMCDTTMAFAFIAQKWKFSVKDFFSKYGQICKSLWICSNLLKKSFMGNFIFLCSDLVNHSDWQVPTASP